MEASRKEPLAPEPFLVRGIEAQLAGDQALAERAFVRAELRDARSVPARYFLADQYFRTGRTAAGLREISSLARMIPTGVGSLAPYIGEYAADRANWPQLRALFRSDPQLEDAVLSGLAADPKNADLILALAMPRQEQRLGWPATLIARLVNAGEFQKAYEVWAMMTRRATLKRPFVFDPDFHGSTAPPPFNWSFASSTLGFAEALGRGRLHVLFYGREDGPLASQLLLLKPGAYRLTMQVSGDMGHAHSLAWTITCLPNHERLLTFSLDQAAKAKGAGFEVPAEGCAAQQLELDGAAPDLPQQAEVTISGFDLGAEPPHD